MKLEFVVAGLFLLFGLVSAIRSLRHPVVVDDGRSRVLLAAHHAAKAGFWLSLGGFFLAYGLVDQQHSVRYVALVPVVMAGIRLLTAALLSRN